jgi:hypothetical protein
MLFKSNFMNVLRKRWLGLIFLVGLSTNVFAQNFNFLSDDRYLVVQLFGHSGGFQTPSGSFADFNGYLDNSNSVNDFYTADQDSVLTPTQLICNTYISLQGTVPSDGPNANVGSYCAVSFNVSNPVTADFELSGFNVSDSGINYDGPEPQAGILSDDPNFNNHNTELSGYLFNNQTSDSAELTFQPGYTYTFFEQMTGFGYGNPFDNQTVNVAWQENMSLTIDSNASPVPEPSSIPLLAVGLTALFQLRRLRQHSK